MCFEGLKQWGISRPGTFSGLVSSRGLSPHVCYSESCGTMEVSFYKGLLQSVILTEVLKVNPDTHLLDKCSTELHPNSEPVYHPPGETNRVHSHQEDLNMPRKRNSQDAATLRCIQETLDSLPESVAYPGVKTGEALMSESINKILWVCYPGSSSSIVSVVPLCYNSGGV